LANYAKLRILHLQLEFHTWPDARPWTYSVGLGLEEGMSANRVQFTTLPSTWLPRAQQILAGRQFDQVWLECVHQGQFDQAWDWVSGLAPVRVGFLGESLRYGPEEAELWPELWPRLATRHQLVSNRLAHLTHAVATDEADAAELTANGPVPAMWWPQAVPERFIKHAPTIAPHSPAIFAGTPYGKRQHFLSHPMLAGLVQRLSSPEDRGIYPGLFEAINLAAGGFIQRELPDWQRSFPAYMELLRRVRRELFSQFLEGLQAGSAVVNLPHLVKSYAGRVVEGMAAGRPIVSWDLPNRPRNRALFEDGSEILLFDRDSPEQLAEHLRRLQAEPALGERIATNARRKIKRHHTVERRVTQILDWTTSGTEPSYAA
jgi:hypothetical protein